MAKVLKVINVVKKEVIDPIALTRELRMINLQKSELEKRDKAIKEKLNKYVDKNSTADGKGNRYFETTDDFDQPLILKREARKSFKLNLEKMKSTFAPTIYAQVVREETVEVIDEDLIGQMIASEELTMDQLEKVTDVKVTYATVFVKQKEEEEGNE